MFHLKLAASKYILKNLKLGNLFPLSILALFYFAINWEEK